MVRIRAAHGCQMVYFYTFIYSRVLELKTIVYLIAFSGTEDLGSNPVRVYVRFSKEVIAMLLCTINLICMFES
jgi:hypothetical protein